MKKRYLTLLVSLFAALALALAGCSSSNGQAPDGSSSEQAEQSDDSASSETIIEEMGTVLVDDEYCTITAVDAFETPSVAGFDLKVENKTDARLDVRMASSPVTIGGEEVSGAFPTAETTAGGTETSILSFYKPDLDGGIDKLHDVSFQLEAIALPDTEPVATYNLKL